MSLRANRASIVSRVDDGDRLSRHTRSGPAAATSALRIRWHRPTNVPSLVPYARIRVVARGEYPLLMLHGQPRDNLSRGPLVKSRAGFPNFTPEKRYGTQEARSTCRLHVVEAAQP